MSALTTVHEVPPSDLESGPASIWCGYVKRVVPSQSLR